MIGPLKSRKLCSNPFHPSSKIWDDFAISHYTVHATAQGLGEEDGTEALRLRGARVDWSD